MNIRNAIAVLLFTISATAFAQDAPSKRLVGLDDIITSAIAKKVFPGATLIVGKPDRVLWQKAYGRQTYEDDSPEMTMDTLFDLASVSKVVGTATCAMKLVEEGRLSLDDPISKYIPGFGENGKADVKVRDLLTHVSGLPAYTQAAKAEQARTASESTADALIKHIAALKTTYTPRSKVTYSCLNMLTMARVNETVLNGRMDDYLKEQVYGPLGMKDTVYRLSPDQVKRAAPTAITSGTLNNGKIHDPLANYYSPDEHCPGNAGLFSTANDLSRYCLMVLGNGKLGGQQVFKPDTLAQMTQVQTSPEVKNDRGFGWDIYRSAMYATPLNDTKDNAVIAHTGYTGTFIWIDKKSRTYIVLLANRTVPNGANSEDGRITGVRKQVCSTVLRSLSEYESIREQVDSWKLER